VAGYWRAPKALPRLVAEGELTWTGYALLHFIAESGADWPEGLVTSNGSLADATRLSDRTVRRRLRELREKHLVEYEDHERVATFTIHLGPRIQMLLRPPLGSPETPDVAAAPAATPLSSNQRKPASKEGKAATTAAATSRARAKTKTKTSPRSLGLGPNGPAETAPTTPQRAASSARRCPFRFRRPVGEGTVECGHRCRDEAELVEHLRLSHGVESETVPPPAVA
jgi:DNA-binding transcriptional ArsR family regulator